MKGTRFFGIGAALSACVLSLFLVLDAGFISAAWAKPPKPPNPPTPNTTKYGYAMFRDGVGDAIKSDEQGPYGDCEKGGEDVVWINVQNDDGSLNWVEFFPGKLYYHNQPFPPSTRRVEFCFNVSDIPPEQTPPSGETAVRGILRWYQVTDPEDGSVSYVERSTDHHGYLDGNSVHAPIMVHISGQDGDVVQFVVDPLKLENVPTTPPFPDPPDDPKAITQTTVDDYYPDDRNVDYLDTWQLPDPEWEPAPYIIYFLNYGDGGFTVTPVQWVRKKPVTWIISATRNPRLYVKFKSWSGRKIGLVNHYNEDLSFEFAVSLNPLIDYPTDGISGAPRKDSTLSATWGDIKAK